jgi:hypothetical protein
VRLKLKALSGEPRHENAFPKGRSKALWRCGLKPAGLLGRDGNLVKNTCLPCALLCGSTGMFNRNTYVTGMI